MPNKRGEAGRRRANLMHVSLSLHANQIGEAGRREGGREGRTEGGREVGSKRGREGEREGREK